MGLSSRLKGCRLAQTVPRPVMNYLPLGNAKRVLETVSGTAAGSPPIVWQPWSQRLRQCHWRRRACEPVSSMSRLHRSRHGLRCEMHVRILSY